MVSAGVGPGLHVRDCGEQASVCRAGQVRHGTAGAEIRPRCLREIADDWFGREAVAIFGGDSREVEVGWPAAFPLAFELAGGKIQATSWSE